jgi:putative oxidoreductase
MIKLENLKSGRTQQLTLTRRTPMNFDRFSPPLLSVLRITTALLLLQHGLMKLVHFPGPQPGVPDPLTPLLLAAAVIEVIGGGLVALGLFTRILAFVLSGEMAVAYFIGHFPHGFWPGLNGGDPAVLFCFVFLYLAAAGGGPWSVDALKRK